MGSVSLFLGRRRFWEFGLKPSSFVNLTCLYGRFRCLPIVLVMEFGRHGQCMFLSSEGTLCVAVDGDDPLGPGLLELEVCIVWDGIKASERCAAQQGVITAAEGDNVEDQVLAAEVVGRTEHYFQANRARAPGFDA